MCRRDTASQSPTPAWGQGSRVMPCPVVSAGGQGQGKQARQRAGATTSMLTAGVGGRGAPCPGRAGALAPRHAPQSCLREVLEPQSLELPQPPCTGSPHSPGGGVLCPCHRQETRAQMGRGTAQTDSSRMPDPGLLASDALGHPAAPLPAHGGGHGGEGNGHPLWSSQGLPEPGPGGAAAGCRAGAGTPAPSAALRALGHPHQQSRSPFTWSPPPTRS